MSKYLDFEIIKEEWGKFELYDGSTLKLKSILVSVEKINNNEKPSYQTQLQNIQTVFIEPSLIGDSTNTVYTKEILLKNIEKQDLEFEIITPSSNKYILDDGTKLNIFLNVIKVARTSLKNKKGEPIYLVDTNFTINFNIKQ